MNARNGSKGTAGSLAGDLLTGLEQAEATAVMNSEERRHDLARIFVSMGAVSLMEHMALTGGENGEWARRMLKGLRPYIDQVPPEFWPPARPFDVEDDSELDGALGQSSAQ